MLLKVTCFFLLWTPSCAYIQVFISIVVNDITKPIQHSSDDVDNNRRFVVESRYQPPHSSSDNFCANELLGCDVVSIESEGDLCIGVEVVEVVCVQCSPADNEDESFVHDKLTFAYNRVVKGSDSDVLVVDLMACSQLTNEIDVNHTCDKEYMVHAHMIEICVSKSYFDVEVIEIPMSDDDGSADSHKAMSYEGVCDTYGSIYGKRCDWIKGIANCGFFVALKNVASQLWFFEIIDSKQFP